MSVSSVWILFASFTEPSVFRMVEVSPKVFGFPFAIDRWLFLGNKFFSRFYGSLHFISLKNSVVIIRIFIFFIFNFNSWCTSKLFFYNVNISTFFRRFFEMLIIDDVPVTGRTVDVDAWSRPTVKYDFELLLWVLPDAFGFPPGILSLQRHVYSSGFSYLYFQVLTPRFIFSSGS